MLLFCRFIPAPPMSYWQKPWCPSPPKRKQSPTSWSSQTCSAASWRRPFETLYASPEWSWKSHWVKLQTTQTSDIKSLTALQRMLFHYNRSCHLLNPMLYIKSTFECRIHSKTGVCMNIHIDIMKGGEKITVHNLFSVIITIHLYVEFILIPKTPTLLMPPS